MKKNENAPNIIINNVQNVVSGDIDHASKRKIEKKNWLVALILSIFLGIIGVDRFYMGHIGMGLLKLFTCGLWGILWIVDIILIATKQNYSWVRWE